MRMGDVQFSAYTEKTESKAQGVSILCASRIKKKRSWEDANIFPYFCKIK